MCISPWGIKLVGHWPWCTFSKGPRLRKIIPPRIEHIEHIEPVMWRVKGKIVPTGLAWHVSSLRKGLIRFLEDHGSQLVDIRMGSWDSPSMSTQIKTPTHRTHRTHRTWPQGPSRCCIEQFGFGHCCSRHLRFGHSLQYDTSRKPVHGECKKSN